MFRKLIAWGCIPLFTASLLLAHGNATHLMGTVTAVGKDTVTIRDKDGKAVVVTLAKSTKYLKDKKPSTLDLMKVGARVVIDAKMDTKTKTYTAEEIQLGVAAPAAAAHK